MVVQVMSEGKRRRRSRKASPTGLKASTTRSRARTYDAARHDKHVYLYACLTRVRVTT
jgi:hypothetical protein